MPHVSSIKLIKRLLILYLSFCRSGAKTVKMIVVWSIFSLLLISGKWSLRVFLKLFKPIFFPPLLDLAPRRLYMQCPAGWVIFDGCRRALSGKMSCVDRQGPLWHTPSQLLSPWQVLGPHGSLSLLVLALVPYWLGCTQVRSFGQSLEMPTSDSTFAGCLILFFILGKNVAFSLWFIYVQWWKKDQVFSFLCI